MFLFLFINCCSTAPRPSRVHTCCSLTIPKHLQQLKKSVVYLLWSTQLQYTIRRQMRGNSILINILRKTVSPLEMSGHITMFITSFFMLPLNHQMVVYNFNIKFIRFELLNVQIDLKTTKYAFIIKQFYIFFFHE